MSRIESRSCTLSADRPRANLRSKAGRLVPGRTVGADVSRNTGIRDAHQVAIIFHRAKDGIRQVLAHDRRLTQIPIIRNIDQHVRAFVCERARNRRVRGFYTNKNPDAKRAEGHQRKRIAGLELADETSHRTRAR